GAGLERVDGGVQAAVGGDHGHRGGRVMLLYVPDYAQPFAIGQAHIGQAEIKLLSGQQVEGFGDRCGSPGLDVHAAEGQIQKLENVRLVVNDQCQRFVHWMLRASKLSDRHHTSRLGWAKTIRMQLPRGSSRRYSSRAWLLSHSSLEIYRPSPVPVLSVVKKGSKTWGMLRSSIPGP